MMTAKYRSLWLVLLLALSMMSHLHAGDTEKNQARLDELFRSWEKAQKDFRSLVVKGTMINPGDSLSGREEYEVTLKLFRNRTGEIVGSYETRQVKPTSMPAEGGLLLGNTIYLLNPDQKTARRFRPEDNNPRRFLTDHFIPMIVLLDKKQANARCRLTITKNDEWYTYLAVEPRDKLPKPAGKFLWFDLTTTWFDKGRVVLMNKGDERLPKDMPRQLWYQNGSSQITYDIRSWQYNADDVPNDEEFIRPEKRLGWKVIPCGLADDELDTEVGTRAVVQQFVEKLQAKDVDELAKTIDVPWLDEGRRIVKDEKQLKKLLQQKVEKSALGKKPLDITSVLPFSDSKEIISDPEGLKVIEGVLTKEDQIVYVADKDAKKLWYVLVRKTKAGMRVVGGPYKLTYLIVDNRIPDRVQKVLDEAKEIELFSLDPDEQKEKPKDGFHGWKILGKTVVKDDETRKKAITALKKTVEDSEGLGAACFHPRHGIRIVRKGKTTDFLICFKCWRMRVFTGGQGNKELFTTDSAQPVFDEILRKAGVELPDKPKE